MLFIGALALFNAFYYKNPSVIFWFCYLSIPLVGIGILTQDASLVKSQLYLLAIPDLFWTIDFIYSLFAGHSLWGFVDYLFEAGVILPKIVTMQHIITLPIIFYSLVLLKNEDKDSWKISIFQLIIVYLLTIIFTLPADNINCAYHLCGHFSINFGIFYPTFWFLAYLLMIYLSRKIFINAHGIFRKFFNILT